MCLWHEASGVLASTLVIGMINSGNTKKLSGRKKKSSSVRCVKIKVSAFYFALYYTNRNVDDTKNHDCDVLMCELILHFRL